jgi:hypothetical protein
MVHCKRWIAATAVAVMVGSAGLAEAGYGGGGYGGGDGSQPPESISDNGAVVSAKKAVRAAVIELHKAEESLAAMQAKLRSTFEATAPWVEVATAQKRAQAELDAAKQASLDRQLKSDPKYAAAVQARDDAVTNHIAVDTDDKSTPDDRIQAAKAVLDTGKALVKMQTDAWAADPAVVAAQAKLNGANARVAAQNGAFDQLLHADKDWAKANNDVESKKQKVSDANDNVARALQQEEDATMKGR